MKTESFNIEQSDYIELNNLLKVTGLCESGGRANQLIVTGQVKVDGQTETRKRRKIRAGNSVEYENQIITVCDNKQ
jgi:ribosome-associated protein